MWRVIGLFQAIVIVAFPRMVTNRPPMFVLTHWWQNSYKFLINCSAGHIPTGRPTIVSCMVPTDYTNCDQGTLLDVSCYWPASLTHCSSNFRHDGVPGTYVDIVKAINYIAIQWASEVLVSIQCIYISYEDDSHHSFSAVYLSKRSTTHEVFTRCMRSTRCSQPYSSAYVRLVPFISLYVVFASVSFLSFGENEHLFSQRRKASLASRALQDMVSRSLAIVSPSTSKVCHSELFINVAYTTLYRINLLASGREWSTRSSLRPISLTLTS